MTVHMTCFSFSITSTSRSEWSLAWRRCVSRPRCATLLRAYNWPGNVRELRNLVQRLHPVSRYRDMGCRICPPRLSWRRASPKRRPDGRSEGRNRSHDHQAERQPQPGRRGTWHHPPDALASQSSTTSSASTASRGRSGGRPRNALAGRSLLRSIGAADAGRERAGLTRGRRYITAPDAGMSHRTLLT